MKLTYGKRLANRIVLIIVAINVVLLALVRFDGQTRRVAQSDMAGAYVCQYPYGIETLSLQPDGTYTQRLTVKSLSPVSNSGRWIFAAGQLTLRNAVAFDTGFGTPNAKLLHGLVIMPVKRTIAGQVYIREYEDLGLEFRRKASTPAGKGT
jgi:hypothetical protein